MREREGDVVRAMLAGMLLLLASSVSAQTTATIAAKTCTLVMSATKGPDGTSSGWSVQFKRGTANHGASDSSAPYGPRSASVDAGVYALTAAWTKAGQTTTEAIGAATCQNATVKIDLPAPPPPPSSGSPDGTAVPPATSITDSTGALWILAEELNGVPGVRYVKRNGQYLGVGNPIYGYSLLYVGGSVYLFGADKIWYRWDATNQWIRYGATPPSGTPTAANPVTAQKYLTFTADPADYDKAVTRAVLTMRDGVGASAYVADVGKPALDASGNARVPVTLTLGGGQSYVPVLELCGVSCSMAVDGPVLVW